MPAEGGRRDHGCGVVRRGGVPGGTRPAARLPGAPLRRPRPGRGGRLRGHRGGAGALAGRGRSEPAGRLAADHGAPPRGGPAAPRPGAGQPARVAPGGGRAGRPGPTRRRGPRPARRSAGTLLHLCAPGPARPGPGGADPALPRRPHHQRGGPGLPGAAAHHGPADRSGQAEDPRRPHPVPGARRRRAARAPAVGAPGGLLGLHRGVRGQLRPRPPADRPRRGGHPAGPDPAPAAPHRAGGRRSAGADAADPRPPRRPDRPGRGGRPPGRPGPGPLGPSDDRRGTRPGARRADRRTARAVRVAGRHRRAARRGRRRGQHRLAAGGGALRRAAGPDAVAGRRAQPGRRGGHARRTAGRARAAGRAGRRSPAARLPPLPGDPGGPAAPARPARRRRGGVPGGVGAGRHGAGAGTPAPPARIRHRPRSVG